MPQQRLHIIFKGKVQGVGFRYTVHGIARKYTLTGWVRNCPDGYSVETELQGSRDDLQYALDEIKDYFKGNIHDVQSQGIPIAKNETGFVITH